MTIWILALVLFAGLGVAGYTQGAIRVAMSMIGLVVSAMCAMPLSKYVTPTVKSLLGGFSVTNPVIIWAVAPLVVFIILLTIFKACAFALHHQVEVYYKYKAGDLRLALWERMNKRVGAALGMINALIYIVLIATVIHIMGYWTIQMSQPDSDPKTVKYLNNAARDLHTTHLDNAARSLDPMPDDYYVSGDIVGVVYHNPLATSRLSRYPALLGLAERDAFKEIANDTSFFEMLQRQAPVGEVLNHPKSQAIVNNPALLQEIWALIVPDLKDLRDFMATGKSAKYDVEPILGRWSFDPVASVIALKQAKPGMSAGQLQILRKFMFFAFRKSSLVATPSKQAILKDVVWVKPGFKPTDTPPPPATSSGQWSGDGSGYTLTLPDTKELTGKVDGDKLKLTGEWVPLVFSRDE